MKKLTSSLLISSVLFLASCSKSSSDTPAPTPPTPPPPTIKDSVNVTRTNMTYSNKEVTEFPILNSSMSTSLYVGRIIKESDTSNMSTSLSNAVTDTNYINKVTIYTTLPTDSISKTGFASYALNQSYFNGVIKNNTNTNSGILYYKEADNLENSNVQFRFNKFRDLIGVDKDMNEYLDLGFSDTNVIDKKNKVVYLQIEYQKLDVRNEPPIYASFIKIPKTNSNYSNLFGTGEPKIVSSISYGISYTLAIMVDSSKSSDLITAMKDFKTEMTKGKSVDYNNLSTADKQIFKNAKVYAVVLGQGKKTYSNAENALSELAGELKKITSNLTYGGYPLHYSLANVSDFSTYKQTFKVAQYEEVTERVPKN